MLEKVQVYPPPADNRLKRSNFGEIGGRRAWEETEVEENYHFVEPLLGSDVEIYINIGKTETQEFNIHAPLNRIGARKTKLNTASTMIWLPRYQQYLLTTQ